MRVRWFAITPLDLAGASGLGRADAATWLDRIEAGEDRPLLRDSGFGKEVKAAQAVRRQWLIEQGLAEERVGGELAIIPVLTSTLRRREVLRLAAQLSRELGLAFNETRSGDRVEGILRRRVDATSGRFALVEKSREFTLVPWQPVLDRQLAKPVSGIFRGDGVNWTLGRSRSGQGFSR